jgi:hypothetical protein
MWRRAAAPSDGEPHPGDLRAARIVTLAATALFLLLVCRWRPWDLFDRAGFSADFYDEQARAFIRGRLHVDPAVPGPEGFLIDGRTYLYYGPLLALARVPFAILGAIFGGEHWRSAGSPDCRSSWRYAACLTGLLPPSPRGLRVTSALTTDTWRTAVSARGAALSSRWPPASPRCSCPGGSSVYHETEMWAAWLPCGPRWARWHLVHRTRRNALVTRPLSCCDVTRRADRDRDGFGIGSSR